MGSRLMKIIIFLTILQIIMEYCAVDSIFRMQRTGIQFSETQLAAVITSALHGLAYLHTMGIVCYHFSFPFFSCFLKTTLPGSPEPEVLERFNE